MSQSSHRFAGAFAIVISLFLLIVSTSADAQRFELVWSDEFDYTGSPSPSSWDYDLGDGCQIGLCGWGNAELQWYTSSQNNVWVEDGKLHIRALRQQVGSRQYTSARIVTRNLRMFTYGRIEIRAKLPVGQGLWPAFWMLPTNSVYGGWPRSGEIDIMEYRGNEPQKVEGTVHYWRSGCTGSANACRQFNGQTYTLSSGDFSTNYNVFSIDWDEDGIRWFLNGEQYHEIRRATLNAQPYPFDQRFHILLNMAIGGNFLPDPNPNDNITFPATMTIDYVRVFQDVNEKPIVDVISPQQNATLNGGENLVIEVEATDNDGEVTEVDFFINGTSFGKSTQLPHRLEIENITDGCYQIQVRARDNDGGIGELDEPTNVTVGTGCERRGYSATPFSIPGTVPLSEYNYGGQGIGYFDTTPFVNQGNALGNTFRKTEGVDIEVISGENGPFTVVSFTESGEWMEYFIEVAEAGSYIIKADVIPARGLGGFRMDLNGELLGRYSRFSLPGPNEVYTTRELLNPVQLSQGTHTLRVTLETNDLKLYRLHFEKEPVSVQETETLLPNGVILHQNYPNPFNPATSIRFSLPESMPVSLRVYDVTGREVLTLEDGNLSQGDYAYIFNASAYGTGVYYYVLETPGQRTTRSMVLVK